jgi:type I restriction-modification system DNA methylase subunit
MIYNIYKEFIPKNNKWSKYVKSKIKQPNRDLIDHIKDYFQCSSKEAKEYISMLATTEINRILTNRGLNKKEIKPLIK